MKVLITSNSFGKFDEAPRKRMLDLGWELLDNRYHHIMSEEEMMERGSLRMRLYLALILSVNGCWIRLTN